MNVEDIASQISVIFKFLGFMFPQVVQTLATGGGITNHHLTAHSLSNISAKKLRLMSIEVSVLHQCRFFETLCSCS